MNDKNKAAAPSAPVVGRDAVMREVLDAVFSGFEHGQCEKEWEPDYGKEIATLATDAILSALYASPDALSECLSALHAIKANGGDPEDVNRATCAIERVEGLRFAENAKQAIDPRLTEWGYSTTDEAITHLGKLLEDQAAFDGLASPDKMEKGHD